MTQAEAFHMACNKLLEAKLRINTWDMLLYSKAIVTPEGIRVDDIAGYEWKFPDSSIVWSGINVSKVCLPRAYK